MREGGDGSESASEGMVVEGREGNGMVRGK